jgi:hypothetical protein
MTATTYETQTAAVVAGTATIGAGETTTDDIVLDSKQNLALVVPALTSEGGQTSNQTMFTFLGQAFAGGEFEEITDEVGRPLEVQVVAGALAPVPEEAAYFYAIKIVANVAQASQRAIEFVASSPGSAQDAPGTAGTTGTLHAHVDATSSGDTEAVSAVVGKSVRVLAYTAVCDVANLITFKSTGGTAVSSAKSFGANGGISAAYNPGGHFDDTPEGEGLVITLGSSEDVGLDVTYVLV